MTTSPGRISALADNNIGALKCVSNLMLLRDWATLERLEALGITGTDLYVIWNDGCDRDPKTMRRVVADTDDDILVEASKRHDHSAKQVLGLA